ncbi:MAG: hypothetical protein OHK0039_31530 [Bacteroidia bacterium]
MRKSELTSNQLRDLNIFNLILEHYGWRDEQETEKRMDTGEACNPEGMRAYVNRYHYLQARFHGPINMISLYMEDMQQHDTVQMHFLFDKQPERILEWIGQVGESLSMDNYSGMIREADDRCEMILLEVSETEIYEVKPSANA